MEFTLIALSGTCLGCRERKDTSGTSPTPATGQGTNSLVKWPDNVAGRFFVANTCIDCDLCKETAPANFKRNEKDGYCFVFKQPTTEAELKLCVEAAEGCPVEAIVDSQKKS